MATPTGLTNSYSNNLVVDNDFSSFNGWTVVGTPTQVLIGYAHLDPSESIEQSIEIPRSSGDTSQQAIYGFNIYAVTAVDDTAIVGKVYGHVTLRVNYSDGTSESITAIASKGGDSGRGVLSNAYSVSHSFDFEVFESSEVYPTTFDVVAESIEGCYIGELSVRMNYGAVVEQAPVEPQGNLLRNSSFDNLDWTGFEAVEGGPLEPTKALFWDGTGNTSIDYYQHGRRSMLLYPNESIITSSKIAIAHRSRDKLVSWYKSGGLLKIELLNTNDVVFATYTSEKWPVGDWIRHSMWMTAADCSTSGFKIRFTNVGTEPVYVESVKVEESSQPPNPEQKPTSWVAHEDDIFDSITENPNVSIGGGAGVEEVDGVIKIEHSSGAFFGIDNDGIYLEHEYGTIRIKLNGIILEHISGAKLVLGDKVELHSPSSVDAFTNGTGSGS
jgi:hypothetical protein